MKYRIAIWGAGEFGQYIYNQVKNQSNYLITYFIDRNSDLVGKKIDGIEVIHPEQMKSAIELNIDWVLTAFKNGLSIYNELNEFGNIKFGIIKDTVFTQQLELKKDLMKETNIFWIESNDKPLLKQLETNIVDYCNLNCKGCSHFSNLYKAGEMVPFEIFCRDLEQIAQNVNLLCFYMLGGEALLNERLAEYIEFSRRVLPYTEIWIVTNGILIPNQKKDFFSCCKENRVGIDITKYKPTAHMLERIIEVLEENRMYYRVRESVVDFGKNIDLNGCANKNEAMKYCRESACHFFRYGKIYKCPFGVLGNKFFEHYNLGIELKEGTDIYDEKLDWEKLVYELDNEPIDACKYCGQEVRFEWEVSNKPVLEEWVI